MIIDQSPLAGKFSYLGYNATDGSFQTNLADATHDRIGKSQPLALGMGLRVTGLDVVVAADDLSDQFNRRPNSLIRVEVTKEMFPKLFADPYAHRVHALGGFEDFRRGTLKGLEVLEVDGVATLVSVAETVEWISVKYVLPEMITIGKVAWSMPASLLTSDDAFAYSLFLEVWPYDAIDSQPLVIPLADNAKPSDPRIVNQVLLSNGSEPIKIGAYRIRFAAAVSHDAAILERYHASNGAPSLGRPLLDGVSILEKTDTIFEIFSLRELMSLSTEYQVIERNSLPSRLLCRLSVPALLEANESISVTVAPGSFQLVEARLNAMRVLRPPMSDKAP